MKESFIDDICAARGDIIDGISDHIMLIDAKDHRILEVNRAFLEGYGLSRDEVLGRTCYEVTHHSERPCCELDGQHRCPIVESRSHDGPVHIDHVHYSSTNEGILVEIAAFPVKDASNDVVRVIHLSRDVTSRKKAMKAELEGEKLRAIIELAGAMSHEINQPLTTLLIELRELLKSAYSDSKVENLLRLALADAERLLETSRKLSRITRYETINYIGNQSIIDLNKASSLPKQAEK